MNNQHTYNLKIIIVLLIISELIFWVVPLSIYYYLKEHEPSFRFEQNIFLYALFAIPVCTLIYLSYILWKNKSILKYARLEVLPAVSSKISSLKSLLKYLLFRIALFSVIVALANPQFGRGKKEIKVSGLDLVIALDISNSMLALDMSPQWNRLKLAKLAIEKLLQNLHGDRIGLVVFAGDAYTQLPITTDYAAARLFLSGITTDMMSSQGTAIGKAIETAMQSFNENEDTKKAIIIISDGENHEDDAITAANAAKEKNIIIHTIGMGSVKGAPIPIFDGDKKIGVKKDANGNTVITRLNENMLRDIAQAGSGKYIKANGNDLGLETLLNELKNMEKNTYNTEMYTDYQDTFSLFISLALICLIIHLLISEQTSQWFEKLAGI
jgi:Ca-activated chloride channel family protein